MKADRRRSPPAVLHKTHVGILLFDNVEVLDFAGPFEVFSRARLTAGAESRRTVNTAPFDVFTVAAERRLIVASGGLRVEPTYDFATSRHIDLLVVPGGFGTRQLLRETAVLNWVRRTASGARLVSSVCTGALVLAQAGLLAGRRATTHWEALDLLSTIDPSVHVDGTQRVVTDGVITSAGVSAGVDMALGIVESIAGRAVAIDTARYMEYPWPPSDPLAQATVGLRPMQRRLVTPRAR